MRRPLMVSAMIFDPLYTYGEPGENATELGDQLGRAADTTRGEFAHAGASALVAACAVGVAFGAGEVASAVYVPASGLLLVVALVFSTFAGTLYLRALQG